MNYKGKRNKWLLKFLTAWIAAVLDVVCIYTGFSVFFCFGFTGFGMVGVALSMYAMADLWRFICENL